MGAGVSTEGAPLTRVKCKNNLGVLFDPKAEEAFRAAATGPEGAETVPWPEVDAYVKTRDERWRDPKHVLFQNLKGFKAAREQIDDIARVHIKGAVKEIPWVGMDLGDERRQCGLDGKPTESLDALYEVAALANVQFKEIMTAACPDGVTLKIAPLKGRDRAGAKAQDEYADKTAPCYSWLFDITRGAALCQTEDAIVQLYASLEANDRVDIVRTKNRFNPPLFNGYQDILMNVAVKVENVSHMCELQIHLMPIKESEALHQSHTVYEYFRSFFLGNSDAVAQRLEMLCKLPVDKADDVDELVGHVLGSDADTNLLVSLCELLTSIQEYAGVVTVREAILAEQEQLFGVEMIGVGKARFELGKAYDDLGNHAKARDACEFVLPIYERQYGSDHTKVAEVLNYLGAAYVTLRSDCGKARDVLERALAIREREYGRLHPDVAATLTKLGDAHRALGDYSKSRDILERALAIDERAYGSDHPEVAKTLTSLGFTYGDSKDHAKKRDLLERALAINERAFGREHPEVAQTLMDLGSAYGRLGDHAKERDLLERALAINERAFGREHPEVAKTLTRLGKAYDHLGDQAKARAMLERALAIEEQAYGPDHPNVKQTKKELAKLAS